MKWVNINRFGKEWTVLAEVRGGKNIYGEAIGIVLNKRSCPRLFEDVTNASTFIFPVRIHVVQEQTDLLAGRNV